MDKSKRSEGAKVNKSEDTEELPAEWADPKTLNAWSRNPRKNARTIGKIIQSIKAFGFGQPIVARRSCRTVVAGNTRLAAALDMGLKRVPVRFVDLTDKQFEAYAIADNRIQEFSTWDETGLNEIVSSWDATLKDIAGIRSFEATVVKEIAVPEDVGDPVSKLGETYMLGPHTLHCNDSAVVEWGGMCDFLLTDPPYGVSYKDGEIANDSLAGEELRKFLSGVFCNTRLKPGAFGAIFYADFNGEHFKNAEADAGMRLIQYLFWIKNRFSNSRTLYRVQHECIHLVSMGDADLGRFKGGRSASSCLFFGDDKIHGSLTHATPKPVDLLVRLILSHTDPGDHVRDCFAGSGSTIIAADQSGRVASACELDTRHCDAIRKRWYRYAKEHGKEIGDGLEV